MHTVILEPLEFSSQASRTLSSMGKLTEYCAEQDTLADVLATAEVIFTRLAFDIDESLLSHAPQLKYVVSPTTGHTHIDEKYLSNRKIQLLSLRNERAFLDEIPATAEHTWSLIMALHRKLIPAHNRYLEGKQRRDDFKGNELKGKTIGILGIGRVGCQIARFAECFGLNILAYDNSSKNLPDCIKLCTDVETLLSESDIVSIHLSLQENTENFLNTQRLPFIKPGAYFINTARGELVDHQCLLKLLNNGQIKGAALDVVPNETLKRNPIKDQLVEYARHNNNLILTPHIAGATFESMEKTELFMVEKLRGVISSTERNRSTLTKDTQ